MSVLRNIVGVVPALLRLVGLIGPHRDEIELPRIPKPPAAPAGASTVKDGKKTTEFWLTIAWFVFHIVQAIVTGEAPSAEQMAGSAAPVVGYQFARGLAKKGA